MSSKPTITVVIPTHNRNDLLGRTLDSVSNLDLPENYRQTIVIENGGRFGAEKVALDSPSRLRVRYEYFEQGNKSAALNHILDLVEDDLLVLFDDDVRVSKDLLKSYSSAAEDLPDCFFGGPTDCDYEQEPAPWIELPESARGWTPQEDQKLYFLGFNWAAFATHLRASGGFDPRVGPGGTTGGRGQETFMQDKLKEHGYSPQYIPGALVWHYVPMNRCDEKWALNRAFQSGITFGLNKTDDDPKLFGVTKWRIRKVCTLLGQAVFYSAILKKPEAHRHWCSFQRQRGILEGIRRTQLVKNEENNQ